MTRQPGSPAVACTREVGRTHASGARVSPPPRRLGGRQAESREEAGVREQRECCPSLNDAPPLSVGRRCESVTRAFRIRLLAPGRWLLAFALLFAVGSPAPGADGRQARPDGLGETVYPLPRDTTPGHVAPAAAGSLWMTDEYGGVTRLGPDGSTNDFVTHDGFVGDLAVGPDGSVWIAEDVQVVRIAPTGSVTRWKAGGHGSADAITSAGGTVWVANAGNGAERYRPRIERFSPDGTRRELLIRSPQTGLVFNGIASAPDGSLWVTESGDHEAWIGRMTARGDYAYWSLPRNVGDPGRIAAGPDGAMWFTGRFAIGRISSSGQVTGFRLGGGIAPHDIAARTRRRRVVHQRHLPHADDELGTDHDLAGARSRAARGHRRRRPRQLLVCGPRRQRHSTLQPVRRDPRPLRGAGDHATEVTRRQRFPSSERHGSPASTTSPTSTSASPATARTSSAKPCPDFGATPPSATARR
jgi:virginiamycin B lyase